MSRNDMAIRPDFSEFETAQPAAFCSFPGLAEGSRTAVEGGVAVKFSAVPPALESAGISAMWRSSQGAAGNGAGRLLKMRKPIFGQPASGPGQSASQGAANRRGPRKRRPTLSFSPDQGEAGKKGSRLRAWSGIQARRRQPDPAPDGSGAAREHRAGPDRGKRA